MATQILYVEADKLILSTKAPITRRGKDLKENEEYYRRHGARDDRIVVD